jgi:hypothetical protein
LHIVLESGNTPQVLRNALFLIEDNFEVLGTVYILTTSESMSVIRNIAKEFPNIYYEVLGHFISGTNETSYKNRQAYLSNFRHVEEEIGNEDFVYIRASGRSWMTQVVAQYLSGTKKQISLFFVETAEAFYDKNPSAGSYVNYNGQAIPVPQNHKEIRNLVPIYTNNHRKLVIQNHRSNTTIAVICGDTLIQNIIVAIDRLFDEWGTKLDKIHIILPSESITELDPLLQVLCEELYNEKLFSIETKHPFSRVGEKVDQIAFEDTLYSIIKNSQSNFIYIDAQSRGWMKFLSAYILAPYKIKMYSVFVKHGLLDEFKPNDVQKIEIKAIKNPQENSRLIEIGLNEKDLDKTPITIRFYKSHLDILGEIIEMKPQILILLYLTFKHKGELHITHDKNFIKLYNEFCRDGKTYLEHNINQGQLASLKSQVNKKLKDVTIRSKKVFKIDKNISVAEQNSGKDGFLANDLVLSLTIKRQLKNNPYKVRYCD